MIKFYIFLISLTYYLSAVSQNTVHILALNQNKETGQEWIRIPSTMHSDVNTFFEEYRLQFGISENSEMKLLRTEKQSNEWSHYKYQQFYKGLKILGAEYILHQQNGQIVSGNGRIERNVELDTNAEFNESKAIEVAKSLDHGKKYIWDANPALQPKAELIILDSAYPNNSGNYVLAYKVELFSLDPIQKVRYFINAQTGELINSYNVLMTCFGNPGTAQTLYTGTQNIETESNNGTYLLHDATRGNGITTQSSTGDSYTDDDNIWEGGTFIQKVGALDVHYGAKCVYDFYKKTFNRDGIDGNNGRIICKVIDTTVYVNAFWETGTQSTNFGIGDNKDTGPLTSLDVVGHEMTHGVTEHTCGLEYLFEAGALNEALSDIFGKTIEFKNDSSHYNWLIGSKFFFKPDSAFRDMANPNYYKNPKNYKGKFWVTGSSDNGGVHTNSGVLNYWFYLLVTGQSGTNEAGKSFQVQAMGFDKTIDIVYQMMKNYLTSTSYYYDAKEASLQVTENIYGKCSDEYRNIAEAWKAVGIGNGVSEGDLLLVNNKIPQIACKEGLYPVEIRLVNQSCDQPIPKGSDITLTISVVQKNKIIEHLILDNDLLAGQSIVYKFTNPAKIDKTATLVNVEASLSTDADTSNNRFTISITKNNNNDNDFRVSQVNISGSPCENNNLQGQIQASYSGCSPVPAGTELDLILKFDNQTINKKLKTLTTLYPNGNYRSTNFAIDRIFAGYKRFQATLLYASDTVLNNNNASFNAVYLNNSQLGYLETFDNNQFDSTLMAQRIDSFQTTAIQTNITNSPAMVFSGGVIYDANNKFIPVGSSSFAGFMNGNAKFTSTTYLCIDTKDLAKAYLSFDYIQKIGDTNYDSLLTNSNYAAGTRIVYRNDRGGNIGTATYLQDATKEAILRYFEQEIPLTGGPVSIEITNLSLEGKLDSSGTGIDLNKDYVLMDNVSIHAIPVSSKDISNHTIEIYPNPFNQSFTIYNKDHTDGLHYQLFNIYGIKLMEGKMNTEFVDIKTEQLAHGPYILKTYTSNGIVKSHSLLKLSE